MGWLPPRRSRPLARPPLSAISRHRPFCLPSGLGTDVRRRLLYRQGVKQLWGEVSYLAEMDRSDCGAAAEFDAASTARRLAWKARYIQLKILAIPIILSKPLPIQFSPLQRSAKILHER